jgi:hypothetical protein
MINGDVAGGTEAATNCDAEEDPPLARRRHTRSDSDKTIIDHNTDETQQPSSAVNTLKAGNHLLELLAKLQDCVAWDERDCLALTDDLFSYQLNNGRYFFYSKAKAAKARLAAWEEKHSTSFAESKAEKALDSPVFVEPEYFAPGVHLFPVESSVLVREDELSSLIALSELGSLPQSYELDTHDSCVAALSAQPFQKEVASCSAGPSRRVTPQSLWGNPDLPSSRKSSRNPIPTELLNGGSTTPAATNRRPSSTPPKSPRLPTTAALDPDDPTCDFSPMEDVEYAAKPRKRARPGSLLLRGLVRQKSSDNGGFFRSSPLSTPTLESGPLADDKRVSRTEPLSESVLEDLLATSAPPTPSRNRNTQHRAVPSIISGITKRHASEATTTSVISYSAAEVEVPHARDGTISSISSLSSLDSISSSITSSLPVKHDEEGDHLPPLDPPEPSGSRFLTGTLGAFLSFPDSLRQRAGGLSPRLAPVPDSSGHAKFSTCFGPPLDEAASAHAVFSQTSDMAIRRSALLPGTQAASKLFAPAAA